LTENPLAAQSVVKKRFRMRVYSFINCASSPFSALSCLHQRIFLKPAGLHARKKPVRDRLFLEPGIDLQSALQRLHVLTEAAFMTGSLVLVNQSLTDRLVNNRNGLLVGGLGSFCITGVNRFNNVLDIGAQGRTLGGVTLAAVFRLAGALTGLGRVSQNLSPVPGSKEHATMRIFTGIVNANTRAVGAE
jgi:hypothetical protein